MSALLVFRQIATALDVPVTFFYDGDGKAREVESLLFLDSAFSLEAVACLQQDQGPDRTAPAGLLDGIDRRQRRLGIISRLDRSTADPINRREKSPGSLLLR